MVISHRGYWLEEHEKNSMRAFERSFSLDFGTETDIRDYQGELVISHDIPRGGELSVEDFFQIYNSFNNKLPLALNIKADGLQNHLKGLINKYKIENYFVFDMSVPDTMGYLKNDFRVYTRQSEYEENPALYDDSEGVWLDEFINDWITTDIIESHINNGKKVCMVSPDLHRREYTGRWEYYKNLKDIVNSSMIHICTDFPEKAKEYFDEKN